MNLGTKIRELRLNAGWTQQKLAGEAGIAYSYVSRLERDGYHKPSADVLLRLARVLKVEAVELYRAAGYLGMMGNDGGQPLEDILKEAWGHAKLLETVEIPIEGKVPAPYPEPKEETYGYVLIPRGLLPMTKGKILVRQIVSDCLVQDGIHPGDYIIVDPDAPFVDGQIYLVRLPKGFAAGRVYMAGNKLRVTSSSGECQKIEAAGAEVLGRVVLSGQWRTH